MRGRPSQPRLAVTFGSGQAKPRPRNQPGEGVFHSFPGAEPSARGNAKVSPPRGASPPARRRVGVEEPRAAWGRLVITSLLLISLSVNGFFLVRVSELENRFSEQERASSDLSARLLRVERQNQTLTQEVQALVQQLRYYQGLSSFYEQRLIALGALKGNATSSISVFGERGITAVAVMAVYDPGQGVYVTNGTTMEIRVQIVPGAGRVLVNTQPRMGVDFQTSARVAVGVAENVTGARLAFYDTIFYIIASNPVDEVDGPSAGAAMTVLVSALLNTSIRQDVIITGTISPDGSVGPVGGIVEKAEAAARAGAKIFLVPPRQHIQLIPQTVVEKLAFITIYRTVYKTVNVSQIMMQRYGMRVLEVSNITQALSIFSSPA